MPAFQYRLILKDGSPADPPLFVTATPTWHERDTFFTRPGRTFRILAINESSDDFHAVWTVEPEWRAGAPPAARSVTTRRVRKRGNNQ